MGHVKQPCYPCKKGLQISRPCTLCKPKGKDRAKHGVQKVTVQPHMAHGFDSGHPNWTLSIYAQLCS